MDYEYDEKFEFTDNEIILQVLTVPNMYKNNYALERIKKMSSYTLATIYFKLMCNIININII